MANGYMGYGAPAAAVAGVGVGPRSNWGFLLLLLLFILLAAGPAWGIDNNFFFIIILAIIAFGGFGRTFGAVGAV